MSAGDKSALKYLFITITICLLIGIIDIITTSKYRMYPFYLVPIYLVLNYNKKKYLVLIFGISLLSMLFSEYLHFNKIEIHSVWNIFMVIIMYYIFIIIFNKVLSEKKIIETQNIELEKSSADKSLLIRESYHRLKNNINSLISLITLQSGNEINGNTQQILYKLNVYSHLFEMLCYSKKTDDEIDLYLYLSKLIDTLNKSFDSQVNIAIKYSEVLIRNNDATSIGLIINELVMNSVKYSAEGINDKIIIEISFEKKQDTLTIYYHDNGRGFDYYEKILDHENHFGLFLIETLINQYNGKLEYKCSKYPEFIISLILK